MRSVLLKRQSVLTVRVHEGLRHGKIRLPTEALHQWRPWPDLASNSRSSSPSIEEIVEKLRSIRETSPELYKEAWDKIPHKTQTAIQQYEAEENPVPHRQSDTHHKTSHETGSTSIHSFYDTIHPSKSHEEQQRIHHTRHEASDWGASARTHDHGSHAHQSSTPRSDKPVNHWLNSPARTAIEDSHKTETVKPKPLARTSNSEETEKALRKSVSAQIPKAHQIMKQAASEQHLPTSLQEVLLATTVYELELIRIGLDKLTRRLENLQGPLSRSSIN